MTDYGQVRIYSTPEDVALAAAKLFVDVAGDSIRKNGMFSVALSGGSTPAETYSRIARDYRDVVEFERVHVFFGDERCVPPDHAESNYRMAKDSFLDHVGIPDSHVHRIHAEENVVQAAMDYDVLLHETLGFCNGRLDLLFLGLGTDGHTASLFPDTAALEERVAWCVKNDVPQLNTQRITLTYPFLNLARNIVFLVTGSQKAEVVGAVHSKREGSWYPCMGIKPEDGQLLWLLDAQAASCCPKP